MTEPRIPIRQYRSLRAWFRIRHRFDCEICGYAVAGYQTGLDAWEGAEKHRAWHRWVDGVLAIWARY